ncbi:MAG: NUDIX hydrolase [Candidatus Omnitrophota bacterium]
MQKKINPVPTIDVIIEYQGGIVLIQRKFTPRGWAIPGGFVEYNETLEAATIREAKEETNLDLKGLTQFHAYSDPGRDPRQHTISLVFIAQGQGEIACGSDAQKAEVFKENTIPEGIVFDHRKILQDYFCFKKGEEPKW